jgi:Flp pilus assembly protein TadD
MMFMHVTPLHIVLNTTALLTAGLMLEPHLGRTRFLFLYLLGGFAGSFASLGWHLHDPGVSAGASGAIAALLSAGAVAGHLRGGAEGRRQRDVMLLWILVGAGFGLFVRVDNAAHLGGFAGGALMAWLFDGGGRAARRPKQAAGVGIDSALLVLLVGGSFAVAAQHKSSAENASVDDLMIAAVDLSRAGRNREAIPKYRRVLELEPRLHVAHYDLSIALLATGDFAGAEREARIATELEPRHALSWRFLGEALEALGRKDEARAAFERHRNLGGPPLSSPDGSASD